MTEAQLIRSDMLSSLGVTALFTTRIGGMSKPPFHSFNLGHGIDDDENAVASNMERLIRTVPLPCSPHQSMQVHGTGHLLCHGNGITHETEADILIATEAGCPVAVRTADCLPVLLADPVNGIVAAVHAGWRGTASRIVVRAVELMLANGACTDSIRASLGPCIGPCCFEIGEDTATMLAASAQGADMAIRRDTRPHADLTAINSMQLLEAGVTANRIENLHQCTACRTDRFYSYRREHGKTGRHLAVVALADEL